MQLKLKRSQRVGGVLGKTAIFCLDARAEYTADEKRNITRYRLQDEVIYSSETARRHAEASMNAHAAGSAWATTGGEALASLGSTLKSAAHAFAAGMSLNITIGSLERGHHIECKNLQELMGAEKALEDACTDLRAYLDLAATFDGREVVITFDGEEPKVIASAAAPQLMAPEVPPLPLPAPETLEAVEAASDGLPPPMPEPEGPPLVVPITRDHFGRKPPRPVFAAEVVQDVQPPLEEPPAEPPPPEPPSIPLFAPIKT